MAIEELVGYTYSILSVACMLIIGIASFASPKSFLKDEEI